MSTGQPAVFVTGEPAWHKLGTVVANALTSAQAIELARLNWEVEQWELKAFDRELGKEALVPGKYANVRKDTGKVLGVVSEHYRIFQNKESFDFLCGAGRYVAFSAQTIHFGVNRRRRTPHNEDSQRFQECHKSGVVPPSLAWPLAGQFAERQRLRFHV
jgi:hypothetical protein